jgi:hypothetical protein
VKGDIISLMSQSDALKNKIAFEGTDISKFKEGVDVQLVMKMLTWISVGFANPSKNVQEEDLDTICKDFHESMNLLKKNLYKEQYL